jgi:hypothetical protein
MMKYKITVPEGEHEGMSAIGKTPERAKENLKKKIVKKGMMLTPVEMALIRFALDYAAEMHSGEDILDVEGFDSDLVHELAESILVKLAFAKIYTPDDRSTDELFAEYTHHVANSYYEIEEDE